jgi:hypothetical protein
VFRWIGLALLGIVVAAAVSVAASRLASQQIGLASQPVSAGDALVPAAERHAGQAAPGHAHARARHRHRGKTRHPSEPAPRLEEAAPPVSPPPEAEPVPPSQPPTGEEGERSAGFDD